MAEICIVCGKENAGPAQWGEFVYCGLRFQVWQREEECEKCAGKKERETFDEIGHSLISRKDFLFPGLDWNSYRLYAMASPQPTQKLLIALDIFSIQSEGNWEIVSEAENSLNPVPLVGHHVFFTRREYAEGYARSHLENHWLGWEIRHIAEVLSKKTVLSQTSVA